MAQVRVGNYMADFVQLLAGSVFGLLAGLAGSSFQAHLQRKDKELDRTLRKREILVEKAEAVFDETETVDERVQAMLSQALEQAHGVNIDDGRMAFDQAGRLKTLLLVHFSGCDGLILEYLQKIGSAMTPLKAASEAPAEDLATKVANLRQIRWAVANVVAMETIAFTAQVRRFVLADLNRANGVDANEPVQLPNPPPLVPSS